MPLIEAWAMTETGGAAWITASHEPRHVGKACFGRAARRARVSHRGRIGHGTYRPASPGNCWCAAPGRSRGAAFSLATIRMQRRPRRHGGGWFHTGDLVRVGPDGSFYFVDRLKNIIRRSGENIAAIEVESILMQAQPWPLAQ